MWPQISGYRTFKINKKIIIIEKNPKIIEKHFPKREKGKFFQQIIFKK